jgi:hypothetical protein
MNYPSVLGNPKNRGKSFKPGGTEEFSNLRRPITSPPIPPKRPISTEAERRAAQLSKDPNYADQLASKIGKQYALQAIKQTVDSVAENKRLQSGNKFSAGTLSTYSHEEKKKIVEQLNRKAEEYAPLHPISSFLGPKVDPLNCKKVKQLDDIEFEDDESAEDEETYMYKAITYSRLSCSDSLGTSSRNPPSRTTSPPDSKASISNATSGSATTSYRRSAF